MQALYCRQCMSASFDHVDLKCPFALLTTFCMNLKNGCRSREMVSFKGFGETHCLCKVIRREGLPIRNRPCTFPSQSLLVAAEQTLNKLVRFV